MGRYGVLISRRGGDAYLVFTANVELLCIADRNETNGANSFSALFQKPTRIMRN